MTGLDFENDIELKNIRNKRLEHIKTYYNVPDNWDDAQTIKFYNKSLLLTLPYIFMSTFALYMLWDVIFAAKGFVELSYWNILGIVVGLNILRAKCPTTKRDIILDYEYTKDKCIFVAVTIAVLLFIW